MRMAADKGLTTPALTVNGFGCALLMTTQVDGARLAMPLSSRYLAGVLKGAFAATDSVIPVIRQPKSGHAER